MSTITPIIFEKNGARVFTGKAAASVAEWLIENGCPVRMEPYPYDEYRFAIEPSALHQMKLDVEEYKVLPLEGDALTDVFLTTHGPKTTNREFLASKIPEVLGDIGDYEIHSRFGDNDIFFAIYVDEECIWEFEVQIKHEGGFYRRIDNPEWDSEFPWEREVFY